MSDPLTPIIPSDSKRFTNNFQVETQHHTIPAGFLAGADDPEALPSVWKYYTNPEGSRYFHKTSPLNVVTREDVFSKDPVAAGHIDDWSDMIMDMFQQETVALSYAYELFLEYDEDVLGCRYYIIDHSKRSVFWLESVSTEDLRMYSAWSTEHLAYGMEEMYWMHMESFPSHPVIPTNGMVNDLLNTFVHAQGDVLTSKNPLVPFSAEKCAQFIKLIKPYRKEPVDGNIIYIIARLNGFMAFFKFLKHFGQPHCRLSRDQRILDWEPGPTYWLSSILSILLFGVPASFVDRFEGLYFEGILHATDFWEFIADCQEDRRTFINISLGAVLMHLCLIAANLGLQFLTPIGFLCSFLGIASSVILYFLHRGFCKINASEAASYLDQCRHNTYGFQYLALLFSLPKAMSFWSIVLLVPQVIFIVYTPIKIIALTVLAFTLLFTPTFWRRTDKETNQPA